MFAQSTRIISGLKSLYFRPKKYINHIQLRSQTLISRRLTSSRTKNTSTNRVSWAPNFITILMRLSFLTVFSVIPLQFVYSKHKFLASLRDLVSRLVNETSFATKLYVYLLACNIRDGN
jgi:hypothetical protein